MEFRRALPMNAPISSPAYLAELDTFLSTSRFATHGCVITDLDGTAVLEREGLVYLPPGSSSG